jgi:hypothetical protein
MAKLFPGAGAGFDKYYGRIRLFKMQLAMLYKSAVSALCAMADKPMVQGSGDRRACQGCVRNIGIAMKTARIKRAVQ